MRRPKAAPYRVEPLKCADCEQTLRYIRERFAWQHASRPADDHAPRPVGTVAR